MVDWHKHKGSLFEHICGWRQVLEMPNDDFQDADIKQAPFIREEHFSVDLCRGLENTSTTEAGNINVAGHCTATQKEVRL